MSIYIIILVFLIIASYIYDIKRYLKLKAIVYKFSLLILILLSGLRYRIGIDTLRYESYFENYPTISDFITNNTIHYDIFNQPLWFIINVLCKSIYNDFLIVQVVHAIIVNVLIFKFIEKTCSKQFMAVILYYCICYWDFNFEILRESLCVAIYLNALLVYIDTKSVNKFIIYVLPIIFIHWFSFIILIFTLIYIHFDYKKLAIFSALAICFIYFLSPSFILNSFILKFVINADWHERINYYTMNDIYDSSRMSFLGEIFVFLTQILFPFWLSKFRNDRLNILYKLLLLMAVIMVFRTKFVMFYRFSNYIMIVLIILSLNTIFTVKNKPLIKPIIVIYLIYLQIHYVVMFYKPSSLETRQHVKYDCRYIPYSSYLTKEKDPIRETLQY